MANTYTLIDSYTATGSVAYIEFTSIPQTYTDLLIKVSLRNTAANGVVYFSFNSNTSNRSSILLYGSGSSAGSVTYGNGDPRAMVMNESGYTVNAFANGDMYIPNYAGSNYKSFSADSVQETNATTAYSYLIAGLWSDSSAITSITLTPISDNFAQHSTAYLYGIKNS